MLKKERIYLSQDKIKTNNNLTQKYSSKKINNSEKLKNKNSNLNKNNNFSGKRINKTEQNSILIMKKKRKNIILILLLKTYLIMLTKLKNN